MNQVPAAKRKNRCLPSSLSAGSFVAYPILFYLFNGGINGGEPWMDTVDWASPVFHCGPVTQRRHTRANSTVQGRETGSFSGTGPGLQFGRGNISAFTAGHMKIDTNSSATFVILISAAQVDHAFAENCWR